MNWKSFIAFRVPLFYLWLAIAFGVIAFIPWHPSDDGETILPFANPYFYRGGWKDHGTQLLFLVHVVASSLAACLMELVRFLLDKISGGHREWSWHELLSRVLFGIAVGCAALFATELLIIFLPGTRRIIEGDSQWERVFFFADTALPVSCLLGAIGGLIWRRSRECLSGPVELLLYCAIIAFVSWSMRPIVATRFVGGLGPMYEFIPDTIISLVITSAFGIVVAASCGFFRRSNVD